MILILLPLSSVVPASATNTFEGLKQTDTGRVDQVIDALTVTLKSGKIIRLSSLDIPGFVYPEPSEHSLKAKEELEKLLPEGTEVILHQTIKPKVGRENRMGQMLAHLKTKKDDIWVQGHMIENGLARVAPTIRNFELSEDMYALEEKARAEKIGLWDEKAYPVLTHDNAMQAIGNFAVVEGVIQKAASVRNNVYLNFGDDWRKDFTIQIKPPVRKLLVREDIDPLALNGQKVRVRGWVREYNGALIELNHPASLEILKDTAQSSTVSKN
ncbi:MAG: thermonuclease family protein [Pseudomonadota bacterium]